MNYLHWPFNSPKKFGRRSKQGIMIYEYSDDYPKQVYGNYGNQPALKFAQCVRVFNTHGTPQCISWLKLSVHDDLIAYSLPNGLDIVAKLSYEHEFIYTLNLDNTLLKTRLLDWNSNNSTPQLIGVSDYAGSVISLWELESHWDNLHPVFQYYSSDRIDCFSCHNSNVLLLSHPKSLNILDIRGPSVVTLAYTSGIQALSFSPHIDHYFATTYQETVSLWDLRYPNEALISQQFAQLVSVKWSHLKPRVMGVVTNNSVYELDCGGWGDTLVMRTNEVISDFAWFPTLFDTCVYRGGSDYSFYNYVDLFPEGVFNRDVSTLTILRLQKEMESKIRVNEDYGIIFPSTFKLLEAEGPQSAELYQAWKHVQDMLTRCKKLLFLDIKWKETEKSREIVVKDLTIYDNSFRRNLLHLCQDKYVGEDCVTMNFEGVDYLSTALISLLNLEFVKDLEDSVELNKFMDKLVKKCKQMPKGSRNHQICSYQDDILYSCMPCKKIGTSVEFFDQVMLDSSIKLQDRVIFGICLLPDDKLRLHLDRLATDCITRGDLTGLFVAVATQQTEELLQSYADMTQDFQTSVLMAVQISKVLLNSDFLEEHIKKYQNILNSARLWDLRFKFEHFIHTRRNVFRLSKLEIPHIELCCVLCHKSLSFSHYKKAIAEEHSYISRVYPNARLNKKGACNFCLNPQPHCSVCRQKVNVYSLNRHSGRLVDSSKAGNVDKWFAFCMKCHHGGHNEHVMDWFRFANVCPVDTCDCVCIHDVDPLLHTQISSSDDSEHEETLVTL